MKCFSTKVISSQKKRLAKISAYLAASFLFTSGTAVFSMEEESPQKTFSFPSVHEIFNLQIEHVPGLEGYPGANAQVTHQGIAYRFSSRELPPADLFALSPTLKSYLLTIYELDRIQVSTWSGNTNITGYYKTPYYGSNYPSSPYTFELCVVLKDKEVSAETDRDHRTITPVIENHGIGRTLSYQTNNPKNITFHING